MTMLPDVSQEGYDEWQQQLYTEDTDRKIQGLGFTHQANDRIADLSRIGVWAETPTPEGPPPPPPAAEPVPEAPPEPVASAAPAAAPAATPPVRGAALSPTSSAPGPSPAPVSADDWQNQIFGQALGVVEQAGGDVQRFADDFSGRLKGARDANSVFGAALNAADRAGADVQAFASSFQPPEPPAPPATRVAGGGAAPVAGGPLQDYARQAAQKAGVDPDIFVRQIQQESGFNPSARSPAGAQGIAQIVPKFHPGVDVTDPYASLDYAANLMRSNVGKYGGDYAKALAAYNAGGGAVDKYGGVPPFEETQRYVNTILSGKAPGPSTVQGLERAGAAIEGANRIDPTGHTFPLIGYKVGSNGNNDPHSTYHLDGGSDLMAPRGTPVVSVGGGTVMQIMTEDPNRPGSTIGGNAVQIRGDDGLDYYYAHLDGAPQLKQGQKISAGDMLGAVGNTGNAWKGGKGETHLHIGIGRGISSGTGAEGGLGQNFDAKGFLSGLLPMSGEARPDQPRVSPHEPDQENNPLAWLNSQRQNMADSLSGAGNLLQQGIIEPLRGALSLESTPELRDAGMQAASVPGGTRALPEVAGVQQSRNPLEALGDTIGGGLRSLGIGGEAAQPVNAPGAGYDPSALRAVTEPPQEGIPLRQDVRDLGQQPQPTIFDQATQTLGLDEASRAARQAQIEANRPTSQGLAEDVGQAVIERSAQEREAPGQLYGADVAAGQALADTTVARAKAMGWEADPDTERFVHDALATATPSNVLLSILTAGEGPALLQLVRGTASIVGAGVGGQGAKTLAQQAGLSEGVQVGAELLGSLAGGIAAPAGVNRSARLLEHLQTPEGQALLRARQRAEFSLDPEAAEAARTATAGEIPPPLGEPGRGEQVVQEIRDMYDRADRQPPLKDRVTQGLQDLASGLDRNVADRNAAVNQMTQRARKELGADFTPDMDAEVYLSTLMGRGGAALQRLRDHITPATRLVGREDWDNLNAYRKLQRDLEVANLRGGERAASAGVATAEDAQAGLRTLEQQLGPKRWDRLQQADQMVQDGLNQLLRDKMDAGLVDRELGEKLLAEHPHYNPTVFLKFLGEDVFSGASVGADRATVNSNLLRRLGEVGATDDTEKPIRSAVRQLVQGEALIDRNLAAQAIVKAAQADPELAGQIKRVPSTRLVSGPLVEPSAKEAGQDIGTVVGRVFGDQPGTISVYEDGKRVLYSIPPEIEQVVKNLDQTQTNFLTRALQSMNAPLRAGATVLSPTFMLRNLIGDAVTTYVREGAGTAARIPMAWWSAARQNDLYRGYMRAGGGMESIFQRSPQDLDKLVREQGGIVARTPGELANLVNPLRLMQRAGEVIEQGPRLATFERHLAAGDTPREAAMAGRRVTVDFARGGEAVRQANALMLFLNARVQGTLNVPRTLRDKGLPAYMRAGTLGAMAAGAYAWNRQPEFREAYADVPDDVKDSSMVWMLPGSERNTNGQPGFKQLKYIAIPTREWASFTAPVGYALSKLDQDNKYDDRPWQDFAASYARNLSPFTGEDIGSVASSVLPAPVRMWPELMSNTRFYSGMPIVSREMEGLPKSQQANERTSLLAKALGDRFGMSPQQIDFAIAENFGGAGRSAVQGIGAALDTPLGREVSGIPPEITAPTEGQQNPLISGILQSRGGQLEQRQYERKEDIESATSEATRKWVQSLPEYQTATPDGQRQMLLIAQQQVEQTASERVGIEPQIRDIGLPPKYLGIKDPEKQRQVEEAVAAYRAWEADPKNVAKPPPEQLKLGVPYSDPEMIDPRWTIANARLQERNRRIRRGAEQQTEAVPVP